MTLKGLYHQPLIQPHPILQLRLKDKPFVFQDLVRSYVELETKYWIDLPDPSGRVRLTSLDTAEYVILGDEKHNPDRVYPDEKLRIICSENLRVKLRTNMFCVCKLENVSELAVLALTRKGLRSCLMFSEGPAGIEVSYVMAAMEEIMAARDLQIEHCR